MTKIPQIACYGEILWDVFPDQKRLGGAPLNVASRLHTLGANVSMISAIGNDPLGKETQKVITSLGLSISHIQQNQLPTGQVTVSLDTSGSASYTIASHAAWDAILATSEAQKAVQNTDALVFGSLACRYIENQEALFQLIATTSYAVFDLNLRTPYYDLETVVALMEAAHFIKMNDEELELIVMALDLEKENLQEELKAVAKATDTASICVTLGADGAMLLHKNVVYTQVGYPSKVVDTVGAGDSFLAGLIYGLLSGQEPQQALQLGCALGSLVAGKAGANAVVSDQEIKNRIK